MKQSDRIRYCREYQEHPLKKEYETKKAKLKKKPLPFSTVFPLVMVVIYLIAFIGCVCLDSEAGFIIAGIGIINLFIALRALSKIDPRSRETENHIKLRKEYEEKGLFEITEQELFEHECCEYDDYREIYICCATKQPLSYRDVVFCKQPGNCRYCRAFVTAYLGPDGPKYWSYEFKR